MDTPHPCSVNLMNFIAPLFLLVATLASVHAMLEPPFSNPQNRYNYYQDLASSSTLDSFWSRKFPGNSGHSPHNFGLDRKNSPGFQPNRFSEDDNDSYGTGESYKKIGRSSLNNGHGHTYEIPDQVPILLIILAMLAIISVIASIYESRKAVKTASN